MRKLFRKRLHLALLFSLTLLITAVNADARQPAAPPSTANSSAGLANQVRHQLVMLPFLSPFDDLEFQVRGNQIVLLGQVVRPALKEDARAAVSHIEGVESVDNQMEVLPPSPVDDPIRRAEFRAIYGAPGFDICLIRSVQPIHIIVKNGHVTLEGIVRSETDRNLAAIVANQVPNVFSVTNKLLVDNG